MVLALEKTREENLTDFQRGLDFNRIYVKGTPPKLTGAAGKSTIRILSWNIERGRDPAQLAATIRAIDPDIACLQEVDWHNERTARQDVLALLAERTGMMGLFGIEFLEVNSPLRSPTLAGGGAIGNALLTRLAPSVTFRIDLPPCLDWQHDASNANVPWLVRRRIRREKRIGHRFGLCAEFSVAGHRLVVCSAHLEDKLGGIAGRWSQYMELAKHVGSRTGAGGAGIIAGDFNTFDCRRARLVAPDTDATALGKPPGLPEAGWWQQVLLPATAYSDPFPISDWTFRLTPFFRAKLDWITCSGGIVRNRGLGSAGTSDHRPIWIDLALPAHNAHEGEAA